MESGKLKIMGAWTKAGIASCVHVQGGQRNENILFDCGFMNSDTTYAKYVFISHGHIDHVGSCISHARAKSLSGSLAVYYVPHGIVEHLTAAKEACEKLDESTILMNIVGVGPGDEINIGPSMKVSVFATLHRVPSQGYAISTVRKGDLLPELRNLTGAEIRELKMMGQTIHGPETEEVEMVYTGDTTMEGLLQLGANSRLFRSHTFITEVTYLDGDRSKAAQYGHVHVLDIVENAHLFRHVTYLVIVHISQKYSVSRVVKLLRDQLPSSLLPKVLVSLHSFGAREHLTRLVDERWERQEQATAGWGWSNHKAQRNYGQYVQSAGQYGANGGGAMNSAARIEEVVEIVAAGSSSVSASVSGGANSRVSGGFRLQSTAALRVGFASGVMAPPPPPPLPPPPSLPPKKYSEVVRATASSNTANHISNSSSSNYQQQSVISIGSSGSGDDSESGVEVIGEVLGDVEVEVEKAGEMSDREEGSNYRYSSSSGGNNRGKQHSSYGGGSSSRKNNVGNKGGRGKSANWHKKSLSKPYRKPGQVYSNS